MGDDIQQQLEAHWQILDLAPNSSLDEVEAAYRQQRYTLARSGDKAGLERLKVAYLTLKAHLPEPSPTPADAPDSHQPTQSGSCRTPKETTDPKELCDALNQALRSRGWQVQEVRQRRGEWQILLDARQAPKPAIATAAVGLALQSLDRIGRVRVAALQTRQGRLTAVWARSLDIPEPAPHQRYDRFAYDDPLANALALPVAALVAWGLIATGLSELLFGFRIWVHEFGHATVAWLRGYRAIPLPFGWTSYIPERSLFVYFGILILLGLLFWTAWREGLRWLQGFAVLAALAQFYMTWQMSEWLFGQLMAFGGIGGEFYLSALMLVGFYFRLPDRWRWDFYRYPLLVLAAVAFWKNYWRWHRVGLGREAIPFGTLLGGEGDANGDMNQLLDVYGWSARRIIESYSVLGDLCLLAILVVYGIFLVKFNPQRWFRWRNQIVLWWGGGRR